MDFLEILLYYLKDEDKTKRSTSTSSITVFYSIAYYTGIHIYRCNDYIIEMSTGAKRKQMWKHNFLDINISLLCMVWVAIFVPIKLSIIDFMDFHTQCIYSMVLAERYVRSIVYLVHFTFVFKSNSTGSHNFAKLRPTISWNKIYIQTETSPLSFQIIVIFWLSRPDQQVISVLQLKIHEILRTEQNNLSENTKKSIKRNYTVLQSNRRNKSEKFIDVMPDRALKKNHSGLDCHMMERKK